jgi:hypothetical protein
LEFVGAPVRRIQGIEQPASRLAYVVDRGIESDLVPARGLPVSADLADELKGGRVNFLVRGRVLEIA